jgi:hypothetical protein
MLIAFDYDGTYTRDPEFGDALIALAKQRGHEVIIVSNRAWPPERHERVPKDVVFLAVADEYKRQAAEAAGYRVDIWIDDIPGTVEPPVSLP